MHENIDVVGLSGTVDDELIYLRHINRPMLEKGFLEKALHACLD
jgi:hypothetical protein